MLISTGSTLIPRFVIHLIAALMSALRPSSSRQTIPISSVTLACRTLVITLCFWPSCQTTGVVINLGGYINQSRDFCRTCAGRGEPFEDSFLTVFKD